MNDVLVPQQKLRNVRLYGTLGAQFGRHFRLAVSSPAEAVQALVSQIEGFEAFLMGAKDKGFGFAVFVGRRNLTEEELTHPPGDEDIRIAPVIFGSKNAGWMNVIVGAVLIVVGAAIGIFFGWTGVGAVIGAGLISAGIGMVVGGVMQLLFPPPKMGKPQERPENTPNYGFSGPINTQAQGHPTPLLIGRRIIGSAVISAGIEAKEDVYVPVGGGANPGGGGGANTSFSGGAWQWNVN